MLDTSSSKLLLLVLLLVHLEESLRTFFVHVGDVGLEGKSFIAGLLRELPRHHSTVAKNSVNRFLLLVAARAVIGLGFDTVLSDMIKLSCDGSDISS